MPHLLLDSTVQQHQHAVPPVRPREISVPFTNDSSLPNSPVSSTSSPHLPYSPVSPVSNASPGNSPAKNGKKKARNRPPKHVRKGTSLVRKSADLQAMSPQDSLEGMLAAKASGTAALYHTHDALDNQANRSASRVVSAPINVPLRLAVSRTDEPRLEAFSSPKWLGTGFSDRVDARVTSTARHCSGPVSAVHIATHNFTYFARSMW